MKYYFYNNYCYPDDGYTTIPQDAVLIPDNHWFLNQSTIPEGKKVTTDQDGLPALVDVEPEPLEQKIKNVHDAIDKSAGFARKKLVSEGYAIEDEYWIAYDEATLYLKNLAENGQGVIVPPAVQTHADIWTVSAENAANSIIAMHDQWIEILNTIRSIRLSGKAAVTKAANENPESDLYTAAKPFIESLENIGT